MVSSLICALLTEVITRNTIVIAEEENVDFMIVDFNGCQLLSLLAIIVLVVVADYNEQIFFYTAGDFHSNQLRIKDFNVPAKTSNADRGISE